MNTITLSSGDLRRAGTWKVRNDVNTLSNNVWSLKTYDNGGFIRLFFPKVLRVSVTDIPFP